MSINSSPIPLVKSDRYLGVTITVPKLSDLISELVRPLLPPESIISPTPYFSPPPHFNRSWPGLITTVQFVFHLLEHTHSSHCLSFLPISLPEHVVNLPLSRSVLLPALLPACLPCFTYVMFHFTVCIYVSSFTTCFIVPFMSICFVLAFTL